MGSRLLGFKVGPFSGNGVYGWEIKVRIDKLWRTAFYQHKLRLRI